MTHSGAANPGCSRLSGGPLRSLALAAQAQTPAQTATLHGVAVDSVTALPVPRAHITLRSAPGANQRLYGALTGPDGIFSLENIAPGEYDAYAERTGYVSPQTDTHLTLHPGDNKTGYTLKLTPTGGITGRVLDSNGEPISGAQVIAGDTPEARLAAHTDETGQFRIGGLPPGHYRVKAAPNNPHTSPEIRTDGTEDVHHAITEFPSRVDVQPGTDSAGIEIRLRRIPFVRFSGRVTGIPPGVERNFVDAEGGPDSSSARIESDGTFRIWLDPGQYHLRAHSANGMISAPVEVEVGGANLDNLELRVLPLVTLAGHLEFDDDQVKPSRRAITLNEYGSGARAASGNVAADNSFDLTGIPAGRYRVNVTPGAAYVKSLQFGPQFTDGALINIFGAAPGDLSVRLSSATASVSGIVTDSTGPLKGARVTLLGSDLSAPNRSTLTTPDGAYTFDHIPPGTWKIKAGEESEGESIELHPKDHLSKDLKPL
jgi:hypothetical protein